MSARSGKPLGLMTPAERQAAVARAVARFQKELDTTAPLIGQALDEAVPGPERAAEGGYPEETCRVIYPHGDKQRVCVLREGHAGVHKSRDRERFPDAGGEDEHDE